MKYLSVCSGIEAATVAWHPLGWQPLAFSEIEPFPSALLAHHWPDVPNLGDMTKHNDWPDTIRPDILVGGTPCQAFSVAGLRQGLTDPRGNLTLVYLSILAQYRPRWMVWENVPGVLSDKTGAFGAFLGGLGQLGYGFAYRILDAQYFGVAQRRRRVFVVGYLGDWRRAAAVLFERESLRGDSAPCRGKREGVAGCIGARTGRSSGAQDAGCGHMIPEIVGTLSDGAHNGGGLNGQDAYSGRIIPLIAHTLRGEGFDASEDVCGRGTPLVPVAFYPTNRQPEFGIYEDISPSVKVGSGGSCGNPPAVLAFSAGNSKDSRSIALSEDHTPPLRAGSSGTNMTPTIAYGFVPKAPPNSRSMGEAIDQSPTVTTHQLGQGVSLGMQVRRLTPTECERLQGFPDGHTLIPYRGKPAADGPRYKAIGNSMAVPVMRWIGERIAMVEQSS